MKAVEVTVTPNGNIVANEPLQISTPRRGILTILDEEPSEDSALFCALMSEEALGRFWLSKEDEEAFKDLDKLPAIEDEDDE